MARLIALQSAPNGVLSDVGTGGRLEPLVGHQVYVYQPGTLTQVQVWQDEGASTTLSQPLTTDSTGAIPGYAQAEQAVDFYDATAGVRIRSQLLSAADVSDVLAQQLPVLPAVQVVATTNQALSGLRTIDTYALQSGDTILLTGQTDPKQNGPWTVGSGAWTRPGVFAHAAVVTAREVSVLNGSQAQTRWQLVTNASIVVDTGSQTWTKFPQAGMPAADPVTLKRGRGGSSDWNTQWPAARALGNAVSGSRLVTVATFGASIAAGCYATRIGATPTVAAKDWFGQVIAALQALYGDGGSGFISAIEAVKLPVASLVAGRVVASGSGGTFGGAWDLGAIGYNSTAVYPHTASSGETLTFSDVRGKYVSILWFPSLVGGTQFSYSIDGAAFTTVNATGTFDTVRSTVVTPTATTGNWHTVVVKGLTNQPLIQAVGGFNDNGIVGQQIGVPGRNSLDVLTNSALTTAGWGTNGSASVQQLTALTPGNPLAPDLFILSDDMAINDNSSVAPYHYGSTRGHADHLNSLCQYARLANPNCEILVLGHHWGFEEADGTLPGQYGAVARGVANAYGGTYVDMWALYRNSKALADAATGTGTSGGYFGPSGGVSLVPLDGDQAIHPGNTGMQLIANQLIPIVEA